MERHSRLWGFFWLFAGLILVQMACSGTHAGPPVCTAPASSNPLTKHVAHVVIVMEENHGDSNVIGNSHMPYLNRLATTYAYAKGYYANTHPSIGNYFMLTAGQIVTNDNDFSGKVTADNIVRHLVSSGRTWKEYSENLPSVGYLGGDDHGYTKHHNPLAYLSDVQDNSAQKQNLVPFTQFAADLANHNLPNFSLIVPNNDNNAHDGTLERADSWLQKNIDPLIQSPDFNKPGGGLLIVTFDEAEDSDAVDGGGRVPWVAVGPEVKKGYVSATCYQHESTLRLASEALGLSSFPGAAATAPNMAEFISGH